MILLLHYGYKWRQGKEKEKVSPIYFIVASIGERSAHEELWSIEAFLPIFEDTKLPKKALVQ